MSDTPETDKEWRHPASFDGSERVVHISVAQKRERERDEARDTIFDVLKALGATVYEGPRLAALRVKSERDEAREAFAIATDQLVQVQSKVREARAALQRLADCDWVITPHDRMDAVRKIAREALEETK